MRKMTDEQIISWNETFKVGHPCLLRKDNGDEIDTRIRSAAWRIGSGHVVVQVDGFNGGWDIDRVKMFETHSFSS